MEHNSMDRLGGIIKNARLNKGLTREKLSELIHISPRYLMSIENENKKPSYDVLFRLVRVLGIATDTIFYPETQCTNTKADQLAKLLYQLNERDLNIISMTIQALIENK